MKQIYSLLRYVILFLIALYVTSLISSSFVTFYKAHFYTGGFGSLNLSSLAPQLFLFEGIFAFLLVLFAEKSLYRYHILPIVLVLLIPAIFPELQRFYIPLTLVCVGLLSGYLLRIIVSKTIGTTPQGESLKKYF